MKNFNVVPCRKIHRIRETQFSTVVIEREGEMIECVESLDDILEQIDGETRSRPSAKPVKAELQPRKFNPTEF